MSLSEYELRILREMEAEFAPRHTLPRWSDRVGIVVSLASLVLVIVLAIAVSVAVAAPVALGCAILAAVALVRSRRRWRTGGSA